MLIRTQNRKKIINLDKVELIEIYENHKKEFVIEAEFNDGKIELGKYKTENQALEILGLIEKEYKNTVTNIAGSMMFIPPKVYHMPED